MMRTVALFIFGTPLARLFDLNGEVNGVRKKHNRAIIAADVRRFGHVINKDGVLGTHRGLIFRMLIEFQDPETLLKRMIEMFDQEQGNAD